MPQLQEPSTLVECFVLEVIPPPGRKKNTYAHHNHGLGLSHLPTLLPTRVLDFLRRNLCLYDFDSSHGVRSHPMFLPAIATLDTRSGDSLVPLPVIWDTPKISVKQSQLLQWQASGCTLSPRHTALTLSTRTARMAANWMTPCLGRLLSCVMAWWLCAGCRVPPILYKAELVCVLLGSQFTDHEERLTVRKPSCQPLDASAPSARSSCSNTIGKVLEQRCHY